MKDHLGQPWSPTLENIDMQAGNGRWNAGANLTQAAADKNDLLPRCGVRDCQCCRLHVSARETALTENKLLREALDNIRIKLSKYAVAGYHNDTSEAHTIACDALISTK